MLWLRAAADVRFRSDKNGCRNFRLRAAPGTTRPADPHEAFLLDGVVVEVCLSFELSTPDLETFLTSEENPVGKKPERRESNSKPRC